MVSIQVDQRVIAYDEKSGIGMFAYDFSGGPSQGEVVFYGRNSRDHSHYGAVRRNLQLSSDLLLVCGHFFGWNFDGIINNPSPVFRQRYCKDILGFFLDKNQVLDG